MRPMLARTYGPRFSSFPCYCQPKLNGIRALTQHGLFQSRGEILWKPSFFPHLVDQINALNLSHLILDGELYVHGWRLQRINSAVGVNNLSPNLDTPSIQFHVFDVIDRDRPFSARWFETYNTILQADLPNIVAVPTALIQNVGDMQMHFNAYTSLGYEGIMLRPDGPYEFGEHLANHGHNMTSFRSTYLWKHKSWEDDEFVCIGVTSGEGKADIGIGALVLQANHHNEPKPYTGDREVIPTFRVGTGFSDDERSFFKKNPPIGKQVKIRYLELTASGVPFNPSFLAVV